MVVKQYHEGTHAFHNIVVPHGTGICHSHSAISGSLSAFFGQSTVPFAYPGVPSFLCYLARSLFLYFRLFTA